ncbi:MAG: hypothetical protein ACI9B9_000449 [Halioglobus sp.]|jgi:hypothetical protein
MGAHSGHPWPLKILKKGTGFTLELVHHACLELLRGCFSLVLSGCPELKVGPALFHECEIYSGGGQIR